MYILYIICILYLCIIFMYYIYILCLCIIYIYIFGFNEFALDLLFLSISNVFFSQKILSNFTQIFLGKIYRNFSYKNLY